MITMTRHPVRKSLGRLLSPLLQPILHWLLGPRLIIILLLAILAIFNWQLWLDENQGRQEVQRMEQRLAGQQGKIDHLKQRDEALLAEIDSLRHDLDAIEELARNELGMIRKDETYFLLVNEPKKP